MKRNNYDDIINLPHHVSSKRGRMTRLERAAQFSPFAALTGHEDAIKETARLTEGFIELSDEQKNALNEKMNALLEKISQKPKIRLVYFEPDELKSGGSYREITAELLRIMPFERFIEISGGERIQFDYIFDVEEI